MIELMITSSVLILVVILLRHFLKGKISMRLQYAIWALVLIRLLVPVTLFESPISVMNAVQAAKYAREVSMASTPTPTPSSADGDMVEENFAATGGTEQNITDSVTSVSHHVFRWELLAKWTWYIGIGIVGMTLLLSNLSFTRKLRKTRIHYQTDNCKLPVYLVEVITSPFLFGFFHPSIYITPEVAGDEIRLHHVLAHELTHYSHGDHIWSILRGLCLTVHWYNPLVWLAAILSRRDSELACDEGTIKRIGEASRMEYGRTLIGLTCEERKAMDLLCCATTMTDGKRGIKERITLIAQKPKFLLPALIAVVLVAAVATGCTFTGAKTDESEVIPLTAEELEQYNKAFDPLLYDEQSSPISVNPISQFLTSYYSRPEDLNLTEFLRYFPSDGDVTDEAEFEALKAAEIWPFGPDVTLDGMPVPIHKFSAETVNKALKAYMGITLEDLNDVGMDELIYLKTYNAYYNFTSDAGYGSFTCTNGERQGDIIHLFGETATLSLKIHSDGFLIMSYQQVGDAADQSGEEASTLSAKVTELYQKSLDIDQLPESSVLLASLPDDQIYIYGEKNDYDTTGAYDGLYLSINGVSRYYRWQNIGKDSFLPTLSLTDINGDGKNELIIILTTSEGTGVNQKAVHVINPENFTETSVSDPLNIISDNVNTSIVHGNDSVTVTVIVNGQKSAITLPENYAQGWAKEKASFGSIVIYEVNGSVLKATVSAQISNTVFAGDIVITYAFDGSQYVMKTIEYVPYEL